MIHNDFQRAGAEARITRFQAEAARPHITLPRPRFPRWLTARKRGHEIGTGRLHPRGVG